MAQSYNDLLKYGIERLFNNNLITDNMKTNADSYIDSVTDENYSIIGYINFDKTNSLNFTFNDSGREAETSSTPAELVTNSINLSNIEIKALKVDADDEDVTYQFSTDGTTWYDLASNGLSEEISGAFYLKIKCSVTNKIRKIYILYKNN